MLKMKIKKGESHRALFIPVLLVIAATFLATSLGGMGENDVTGAQVMGSRCTWVSDVTWPYPNSRIVQCPANRPNVVSGGCGVQYSGITNQGLAITMPLFGVGSPDSWICTGEFNNSGGAQIKSAYAYCCR